MGFGKYCWETCDVQKGGFVTYMMREYVVLHAGRIIRYVYDESLELLTYKTVTFFTCMKRD